MKTVLITGAAGFVGKNLIEVLRRHDKLTLLSLDLDASADALESALRVADVIVHLAGVNRPQHQDEFKAGNTGFTDELCGKLEQWGRNPTIIFSSSIQAALDNPYGVSKRLAEERLKCYAARQRADVVIFRFPNIFGKWCRPSYNSVVATFCHNVAHDLPLTITDPSRELDLVHIDDVVRAIVEQVGSNVAPISVRDAEVSPVYRVTLGVLADTIRGFRESRKTLVLPAVGDQFVRALYSTYLSYLEPEEFGYALETRRDNRGALAEFVRTREAGQIFVSRTKPGVARGHHFHHTKTEKFLVLEGEAIIRFRQIQSRAVIERRVSGGAWEVVDIPPGYTHSIENVGMKELITLFWASEPFDPARPDTYGEKV